MISAAEQKVADSSPTVIPVLAIQEWTPAERENQTVVHINKALDTVNHSAVHTASRLWHLLQYENLTSQFDIFFFCTVEFSKG